MDIFTASGFNTLDVLYLDVHGAEFDILTTIPFDSVDISVMILSLILSSQNILQIEV